MPTDSFVVAAAQLGPSSESVTDNVTRVLGLMEEAAERGVAAICFPELALSPYFCLEEQEQGHWLLDSGSRHIRRIQEVARQTKMVTVLPFAERSGDVAYNSSLVISQLGAVEGVYRKVHLPVAERRHFTRGTDFRTFQVLGIRVGILICADRSFPESWRVLGIRGVDIVFAPYNTCASSPRVALACPEESQRLPWLRESNAVRMRASAQMNGFFVIGAGKAGIEWGRNYIGDSLVISPWGDVIARAETDEDELVLATYREGQVRQVRGTGHYDRREPSAYLDLTRTHPRLGNKSARTSEA